MSKISEKASRAKRLRDDDGFREFIEDVRNDAIEQFLTSGAAQADRREEAHAIIRALNRIEARLAAAISNETIEQKGQHRGSD